MRKPFVIFPRNEYHIAFLRFQLLAQKVGQIYFSHKAKPLRILFVGRDQSGLTGYFPHAGFFQLAHRKKRVSQLFLRQLAKEIGLILARVHSGQKPVHRSPARFHRFTTGIMACGHIVGAQLAGFVPKKVEFDFAVAQNIGIRRASAFVFAEHIVDNAFEIFLAEIENPERNTQMFCNGACIFTVFDPVHFVGFDVARIVPIEHKGPDDFIALIQEQFGRHRRIHAARQAHHYTSFICHRLEFIRFKIKLKYSAWRVGYNE